MKNSKLSTPIVILGSFILITFTYVSAKNILPNNSSNSYFTTEEEQINAKIENMNYNNGKLIVNISGTAIKGCVKSTITAPDINSKCWIKIENNQFKTSIYKYKKYYIWLIDENNNISNKYEYKVN